MRSNNDYLGNLGSSTKSIKSNLSLVSYPTSNKVVLNWNDLNASETYQTDFYIQLDKWQHLALSVDKGKARVYLDGMPSDGDVYTYHLSVLPNTIPVPKNKVVHQGNWIKYHKMALKYPSQ